MEMTFAFYGFAAVAVVGLSRLAGRTHPAFNLSLILLGSWALSNAVPPVTEPWLDAACFYAALGVFNRHPRGWVAAVAALFIVAILFNLFAGALHPYHRQVVLNAIFAIQLATVAAPGGINARRRFRHRCVTSGVAGAFPAGAASVARQEEEG